MIQAPSEGGRLAGFSDFINELRRRRVVRALLLWGVVAFAVLQVYEPVMHGLHLPEWTLSFVVIGLGLGFPVTVGLSWMFDLTLDGIERTPAAGAPGAAIAPTIAVLPFVNLSSDKEQEYFSDGIAEEILNSLAQLDGLRVIGRTSSFSMKGRNEDLRTIGQRLNAAYLLEGSVRKAGRRVRITSQLIEAAGGTHLWSQEFDRGLTDVFAVQEEIARAVVAALQLKLLPAARPAQRIVDPEAHDLYLRSQEFMRRGSAEDFSRAVETLQRAVERDPGYAMAWAALARARFWAADQGQVSEATAEWSRALAEAEKAIGLDPALSDGYLARGALREFVSQDWTGARLDLERARALSPGSPIVQMQVGSLLAGLGHLPEATAALRKAAVLDPLSADVQVLLAMVQLGSGWSPEAHAAAALAVELAPTHLRAARTLGFSFLLQHRLPEARAAFHGAGNVFVGRLGDAMVDHALGDAGASQRALDLMLSDPSARRGSYQIAEVHAWRGDTDLAFDWLDRAVEARDGGLLYLKFDPLLEGLRRDARFAALLRRLDLPVE